MARPIEATPRLTGKDAREFLAKMESAVMTPERWAWLKLVAEQSKQAENKGSFSK